MARESRRPPTVRDPMSRRAAAAFAVFCAALAFGVAKGAALDPAPASASAPASVSVAATKSGPGDERLARAAAVVRVLNGHVALWRLQHGGRLPDFNAYPDWQQLLQSTDRAGWPSGDARPGGEYPIGPYLAEQPVNPLNGLSNVIAVRRKVRHGDAIPGGGRAGFVVSVPRGDVFATDAGGTRSLSAEAE
jgi:hypothetical protein